MTAREGWLTQILALTDPWQQAHRDWAFCPHHLQSGFNLKSRFPLLSEYRSACLCHCQPALESCSATLAPWVPSCPSARRLFVCLGNGTEGPPEHSLPHPWNAGSVTAGNAALALPIPTSANEGLRVCYYLGHWNQGISLWGFWGPLPTGTRLKDHDSDQRPESQFKGLLAFESLHDHLPITNLTNRVGYFLFCALLVFNSASYYNHTILFRGPLRELRTELWEPDPKKHVHTPHHQEAEQAGPSMLCELPTAYGLPFPCHSHFILLCSIHKF